MDRAPELEAQRLDLLIVVYTRSFSQALSREQLERLHEEVLEFVEFYRASAGDDVDLRISLLQLDRALARTEASEVAPGRYYLAREDIEDELVALGMRDFRFDEVIVLYAWNNANPDGAVLAYGGGAVGPDGKFLGDAGFNSIGVFAWDPGRISQIMIHEVLHNIDDMFSMSGMPDGFLNSDEMSRNMPRLLAERPGAFLPQYSDYEMTSYAERELANRATYPWSMQLVYYRWMLERTPREAWLSLRYGRRVPVGDRARRARPLYERIFLSGANHDFYFPVMAGSEKRPPHVRKADGRVALRHRSYRHTDFDGSVLFEGAYYSAWLGMPRRGQRIRVTVSGHETEIVPLALGDLNAPARVVTYERAGGAAPAGEESGLPHRSIAPVTSDGVDALAVAVRAARFGEPGPPVEGARLEARANDNPLPVAPGGRGGFQVDLSSLGVGTHRVTLTAKADGFVFVPRVVEVERRLPWRIWADSQMVASNGSPLDITIRLARDEGARGARVIARLGDREVVLLELEDGRYSAVLPEGLQPGLHTVRVRAELPATAGTEAVEREIPLYVEPRGWIEVPARIDVGRRDAISLEARVRDRMGKVVKGAGLRIAVVVGPELIPMHEHDGSGLYRATLDLPPGQHRVFVIGLEGSFERRAVLVGVR